MADNFPGTITIGGRIPRGLLEEFLGKVASTSASVGDYGGPVFDCKDAEGLRGVLDQDGLLVLADVEARYGQFEELEGFLCEHVIAFDRHSDGRYDFDPENVMFRPGMKQPVVMSSNNGGDSLTDADRLRPVAKELARLATARLTKDKLLAAVRKASRNLKKLLPPEVEPLPPLEIVE